MSKIKKPKRRRPRSRHSRKVLLAIGGLVVLTTFAGYRLIARAPNPAKLQVAAADCAMEDMRRAEHRPALPASLFVGRVRAAYAAADVIPNVLDQLYCYCRCRENIGHKSLLSCYVNNHAARCDVCIVEAEMANYMTAEGTCAPEIQQAIDKRFDRS